MLQFSYLPYFPSQNSKVMDLKVNRVHLFNFAELKDKYIENTQVKEKVRQLCEMYVDQEGRPSSQITIAVIDENYSFSPLSEEQREDMQNYALALLFCSIVCNQQNGAWASENFKLFHQNFDLTSDMIAYEAGSYVKLKNLVNITDKKFYSPDFITNSLFYNYDEKLFESMANLIDARKPEDQFIFKTLDWVKLAFSNSESLDWSSRLVMLCTAFEVFLKLPRRDKETEFSQRLQAMLEVPQMELLDERYNDIGTGHPNLARKTKDGRDKTDTIYGWWARDFYWVRSEIVHTGELAAEDYKNHNNVPHHELAVKMLRFCLYRELERQNYLGYKTNPELGDFSDLDRLLTISKLREIEELIAIK